MIVPGSVNPVLWSGGDPLDEYGLIERSVRNRADAGAYWSRVFAAGTTTKFAFGGWFKGADLVNGMHFLSCGVDAYNYDRFLASSTGALGGAGFSGANPGTLQWQMTSNRLIRDLEEFYHVHFVYDSTQAVASDRLKLQVNGVTETSFSAITYPAQNRASYINTARLHRMMSWYSGTGSPLYSEGYMASPYFVDGAAPDASYFGRFHPRTAQWRPRTPSEIKAVVDAGGVNSHFLEFKDGSASTAAALGKDSSIKGNNWTPYNVSIAAGATCDWLVDTPTNNFSTINSLCFNTAGTTPQVSNGGLKFLGTHAINASIGYGSIPIPKSGVWQWELKSPAGVSVGYIGVARTPLNLTVLSDLGKSSNEYAYRLSTGNKLNVSTTAYAAGVIATDTVGLVFDSNNRTLTIYKNGVSLGPMFSGLPDGDYLPGFDVAASEYFDINFGQRHFDFPIAGALPLNTKNLQRPSIPRAGDVFVAKTDAGGNIKTTMDSAAPWADWIRIYKRRDAVEGWRWQFSDDAGYYLDCSSTAAKAAFAALGGTSYIGYALRVGVQYGVTTGTFAHVTGANTVITDGLANSRKMVVLKRMDAAGDWITYHPDLTAGKLLYMNTVAAETADASISAITATGFTVASALPSGTYRWIAIEDGKAAKLGRYTGNASTEGPFYPAGGLPTLCLDKNISQTGNWNVRDTCRNPGNVAGASTYLNLSSAEDSANANVQEDIVSNGVKVRHYASPYNVSGNGYVYLLLGIQPYRYTNAR